MNAGFILLYRQITEWEWYQNPNTFRVFLHCLLMANFTDGRFEGKEIKRGQFVTSLPSLADQTKLSIRQVRVALDHLIMTGELTNKSYTKFRVITVVNYDKYQSNDRQIDSQVTVKRQQYNNNNNNKKGKSNEDDDSNILYLSSAEAAEYIRKDQEIEEAALSVGLTVSESSIQKARDLSLRYGQDKLLNAIKKAIDVPKWSYVEGILRNEPTEEELKAALQRSSDRMKQSMIARGEWDTEYDCSTEIAEEYRAKGISPEEVRMGLVR